MEAEESRTIHFVDPDSEDEGVAILRQLSDGVAVCFSLKRNGDIEFTLSAEDARRIAEALSIMAERHFE